MKTTIAKLSAGLVAAMVPAARGQSLKLVHAATAYEDAKEVKFNSPEGVACTDAGNVVVADSGNGRLLMFTYKDGAFRQPVEVKIQQLGRPVRVQIDSKGDVLSLDQRTRRITRVGTAADFRGYVEPAGMPEGHGFRPIAFKLDKADNVYLLDVASARVVVINSVGAFQRELPLPKGQFVDVAVDASGTVYALDASNAQVWSAEKKDKAFTALSKPLKDVASFPSYLALTDRGFLVLVDSHGNGLVVLGPDGSYLGRQLSIGWADGSVYYPGQICIDAKGEYFIADRNNNRVQAFTAAK